MDADWLKLQFEKNPEKKKSDLAEALLIKPSAISKILNGTRHIRPNEYDIIQQYFNLPVTQQGASHTHTSINQLEHIAGRQIDKTEPSSPSRNLFFDDTPSLPDNTLIFTVNDTMMEPTFMKGTRVMIDLEDNTPEIAGVFLLSDGYSQMLRECKTIPDTNNIQISADSYSFETQQLSLDDIVVIGKAVVDSGSI
jgi:hypothetical protein